MIKKATERRLFLSDQRVTSNAGQNSHRLADFLGIRMIEIKKYSIDMNIGGERLRWNLHRGQYQMSMRVVRLIFFYFSLLFPINK
jgi:hypothetical protein